MRLRNPPCVEGIRELRYSLQNILGVRHMAARAIDSAAISFCLVFVSGESKTKRRAKA